jgi:predicted GNAT family N-acyltransferase
MIPDDFTIETADWSNQTDRDACSAVREEVFINEQKVAREDEWDEFDAASRHVLARDSTGKPIGTGRLTAQHMLGRMAVLKDWRGKQVGAAIVRLLLEQARALAYPTVEIHAQSGVLEFYRKLGFVTYGNEFVECDIKHFHMRLELAPQSPPPRAAPGPRPETQIVTVESRDQAQSGALQLIAAARREICIYSRDLDPVLYDTEAGLEALKQFAISGRGCSVRILVQEPRQPASRGHRLIALAQRLTSVFSFRTPVQDDDLQYPSAFLLNDVRGYYFRVLGSRYEGEIVNYAPGRHAQLQEYFNQVWERSEPSEEMRQLAI